MSTAALVLSVAATGGSASFAAGFVRPGPGAALAAEGDAVLALLERHASSDPAAATSYVLTPGAGGRQVAPVTQAVPIFDVEVAARYPHDARAFTQGLIWRDGGFYESVGQLGRSEVRRVSLADGRVLRRVAIPADQFGEGLAAHGGELVSLTWQNGIAHRWDARTLKPRGEWRYPGEGWGLAGDGRELALSDGTPTLRFMDPRTFTERRRVTVTLRGRPVRDLNELEWVDGALWGNVWHTPYMVRIDPASGRVTALADLSPLVREVDAADPEAVANGIAWDSGKRRLFVTGKLWPTLFEIRLKPRVKG